MNISCTKLIVQFYLSCSVCTMIVGTCTRHGKVRTVLVAYTSLCEAVKMCIFSTTLIVVSNRHEKQCYMKNRGQVCTVIARSCCCCTLLVDITPVSGFYGLFTLTVRFFLYLTSDPISERKGYRAQCNFHQKLNLNRNWSSVSPPCMLHTTNLFIGIGKKIGRSV